MLTAPPPRFLVTHKNDVRVRTYTEHYSGLQGMKIRVKVRHNMAFTVIVN